MTMGQFLHSTLVVLSLYLLGVNGDYECVCNYNVEQSVLPKPDLSAQPLGYLYEFDCKPMANADGLDTNTWLALAFEHQLGYLHVDAQIQEQICPGSVPDYDMLTTTKITEKVTTVKTTLQPTTQMTLTTTTTPKPTTVTTTPKPTTTTIASTLKPTAAIRTTTTTSKDSTTPTTPITTTTTLSSTTPKLTTTTTTPKPTITTMTTTTMKTITTPTMTTSKPTTTKLSTTKSTAHSTVPATTVDPVIGNTDLCPLVVQHNSERASSQLGQYNSRCYELIMTYNDTWMNAESKCSLRGGHLADIVDSGEQFFLTRFLQRFTPHHAIWIGLNDRKVEGKFVWTSGTSASYYNWYKGHSNHFLSHNIEDCTVFIPYQNGSWDDLPCQIYHNKPVHYPTLCEYKILR